MTLLQGLMDWMSGNVRNEPQSIKSSSSLSGRQVSQVPAVSYVNTGIINLCMAKWIFVYRATSWFCGLIRMRGPKCTREFTLEICSLLGYCATYSANISWPLKMGPICCSETSVRNDLYSPRNKQEESRSFQIRDGSSKSFEVHVFSTYNTEFFLMYFL
jgi:hypothetical protein